MGNDENMGREIKFRVWDPKGKQMIENDNLVMNCDGFFAIDEEGTDFPMDIVMQYIGIKDKNNREIYEGDIVRAFSEGSSHVGEIKWRDSADGGACPCYIIYPAFFNNQFWHLNGGPRDNAIEVIGNIYENPELLKS